MLVEPQYYIDESGTAEDFSQTRQIHQVSPVMWIDSDNNIDLTFKAEVVDFFSTDNDNNTGLANEGLRIYEEDGYVEYCHEYGRWHLEDGTIKKYFKTTVQHIESGIQIEQLIHSPSDGEDNMFNTVFTLIKADQRIPLLMAQYNNDELSFRQILKVPCVVKDGGDEVIGSTSDFNDPHIYQEMEESIQKGEDIFVFTYEDAEEETEYIAVIPVILESPYTIGSPSRELIEYLKDPELPSDNDYLFRPYHLDFDVVFGPEE